MYREFEELALVKRFIASCLTILLVGALVALFLSSLDNYYGFRFYFVYIVIFKIPAIFVGGFLFSIIADRWIVRHLKKGSYSFQILLYSLIGIIISIIYSVLFGVLGNIAKVIYFMLLGLINANVYFHLLLWLKKK